MQNFVCFALQVEEGIFSYGREVMQSQMCTAPAVLLEPRLSAGLCFIPCSRIKNQCPIIDPDVHIVWLQTHIIEPTDMADNEKPQQAA